MAVYTTTLANFDTLMESLPDTTVEMPHRINITGLAISDVGGGKYNSPLRSKLIRWSGGYRKYIDLSPTTLPSGLTNMGRAFEDIDILVYPPETPSTVTNMAWAFSGCYNLRCAPNIPDGVTDMQETFIMCTAMKYVPLIPSSVTKAVMAFYKSASAHEMSVRYLYFNITDFSNVNIDGMSASSNLKAVYVPSAAAKASFEARCATYGNVISNTTAVQEMYTVADITELNTLLQSLPDNTTDVPYYINLTTLTSAEAQGNSGSTPTAGTLQYVLKQNSTKYVDLYILADIGAYNTYYMCYGCTTLVGLHFPNTTTWNTQKLYIVYDCTNLKKLDYSTILFSSRAPEMHTCNSIVSIGNTQDYDVVFNINSDKCYFVATYCANLEIIHLKNEFTNMSRGDTLHIASNPKLTTIICDNAKYMPSYCNSNNLLADLPIFPKAEVIRLDLYACNITGAITTQRLANAYPLATSIELLDFSYDDITSFNVDFSNYTWSTYSDALRLDFRNCKELTECICTNLDKIYSLGSTGSDGNGIFYGCSKLERALFHDLVYIGDYRVDPTTGEITISGGNGHGLEGTFRNCTSLTEVDLSSLVYVRADYNTNSLSGTFNGCTSLTSIDLSSLVYVNDVNSTVTINNGVFSGCTSLQTVTLNSDLYFCAVFSNYNDNKYCKAIGPYMFADCTSLQSITGFPYRIRSLEGTFKNCTFTNLNNIITLPNNFSVTTYTSTFEGCANLQNISLPNTAVYNISRMCYGCTSLTSVELNNLELIAIADNAFNGCTNLTNIALPKLKYIYSSIDMFNGCPNIIANTEFIKDILFKSTLINNSDIKASNDINVSVTLHCTQSNNTINNNAQVYSDLTADSNNNYILPYNMLSNNIGLISKNYYNKTFIIQNLDNKVFDTHNFIPSDSTTKLIIFDTDIDPYNIAKDLTYNTGAVFMSNKIDIANSSIFVKTTTQRARWINILTTCAVFGSSALTQEEAEQLVKLRKTSMLNNKSFSNIKIGNTKITTLFTKDKMPYWSKGDNGYGLNYTTTYDIGNIIFENRKMCTVFDYIQHKKEYESANGAAIGGIIKIKNSIPIMIALCPNIRRSETQLTYTTGDRCGYAPADVRKFKMFKDNTVAAYNMTFSGDGYNFYTSLCTADPTGTATDEDLAENYPLTHAVRNFRKDKQYYNKDWYLPTDWGDITDQSNGYSIDYSENEETIKRYITTNIILSMVFGYFPKSNSTGSTPPMEFIAQYRLNGTNNPYVAGRSITALRPGSNYGDVTKASYFLPCAILHRVGPEYDGSQQIGSLK